MSFSYEGYPMEHPLIHDRGRGPELLDRRITIYNLVPFFLRPDTTEVSIAESFLISVEQVAAMRAYFLDRYADVLEQHERIEERIRKGMEVQAKRFPPTPYDLVHFPAWVQKRQQESEAGGEPLPESIRERLNEFFALKRAWMERHESTLEVACTG